MLSPSYTAREVGADALKFIAIIMVVFVHAGNELPASFSSDSFSYQSVALFFKQFITNGICRIAVPIFFFISGYLASRHWVVRGYIYRLDILKKAKSILLPYLIWSFLLLLVYFVVQIPEFTHRYFNKILIKDNSLTEILTTLFVSPIPYQLWFLRDLFILFLFGPVLFAAVKKIPILFFLLVTPIWLTNNNNFFLSTEGLLFFSMGFFFGLGKYSLTLGLSTRMATILWIFLAATAVWLKLVNYTEWILLIKIQIIWGCIVMLNAADIGVFNNLARYSTYTFPVFLLHEPLLTFIKKFIIMMTPRTTGYDLFLYLFAPTITITITISVIVAKLAISQLPKVYVIMVGGRAK